MATETERTTARSESGPPSKLGGKNQKLYLLAGAAAVLYLMTKGHNAAGQAGDGSSPATATGSVVPFIGPAESAGSMGDQYSAPYIGGDLNSPFQAYPGYTPPGASADIQTELDKMAAAEKKQDATLKKLVDAGKKKPKPPGKKPKPPHGKPPIRHTGGGTRGRKHGPPGP